MNWDYVILGYIFIGCVYALKEQKDVIKFIRHTNEVPAPLKERFGTLFLWTILIVSALVWPIFLAQDITVEVKWFFHKRKCPTCKIGEFQVECEWDRHIQALRNKMED